MPEVTPSEKMNLNPEPLKVVEEEDIRCRNCAARWGYRYNHYCLHPDPQPYPFEKPKKKRR